MSEQTEKTADSAPLLPQLIGRLGLYATYVAALISLAVAGDLDVLMRRAHLVGWLALLVGTGPLVALLLSTLASYVNYYGVWRILRGKDEYDAGQEIARRRRAPGGAGDARGPRRMPARGIHSPVVRLPPAGGCDHPAAGDAGHR